MDCKLVYPNFNFDLANHYLEDDESSKMLLGLMALFFNPHTKEAEAGGSLSSRTG